MQATPCAPALMARRARGGVTPPTAKTEMGAALVACERFEHGNGVGAEPGLGAGRADYFNGVVRRPRQPLFQ